MESLRVSLHEEVKLAAVLLEEQQVAMKAAVNALNEASLNLRSCGVRYLGRMVPQMFLVCGDTGGGRTLSLVTRWGTRAEHLDSSSTLKD